MWCSTTVLIAIDKRYAIIIPYVCSRTSPFRALIFIFVFIFVWPNGCRATQWLQAYETEREMQVFYDVR